MRKYSIDEIESMRGSLYTWKCGYEGNRDYIGSGDRDRLEAQLRTFMANGTEPDELKAKAAAARVEFEERQERRRRESEIAWEKLKAMPPGRARDLQVEHYEEWGTLMDDASLAMYVEREEKESVVRKQERADEAEEPDPWWKKFF